MKALIFNSDDIGHWVRVIADGFRVTIYGFSSHKVTLGLDDTIEARVELLHHEVRDLVDRGLAVAKLYGVEISEAELRAAIAVGQAALAEAQAEHAEAHP